MHKLYCKPKEEFTCSQKNLQAHYSCQNVDSLEKFTLMQSKFTLNQCILVFPEIVSNVRKIYIVTYTQGIFEHFDKSLVILTLQRMTFLRADWLSGRAIYPSFTILPSFTAFWQIHIKFQNTNIPNVSLLHCKFLDVTRKYN